MLSELAEEKETWSYMPGSVSLASCWEDAGPRVARFRLRSWFSEEETFSIGKHELSCSGLYVGELEAS